MGIDSHCGRINAKYLTKISNIYIEIAYYQYTCAILHQHQSTLIYVIFYFHMIMRVVSVEASVENRKEITL